MGVDEKKLSPFGVLPQTYKDVDSACAYIIPQGPSCLAAPQYVSTPTDDVVIITLCPQEVSGVVCSLIYLQTFHE